MILWPQIFDVTANENARYKRNELEFRFSLERVKLNCVTLSLNFEYLYVNKSRMIRNKVMCDRHYFSIFITSYYVSIDLRFVCIFKCFSY